MKIKNRIVGLATAVSIAGMLSLTVASSASAAPRPVPYGKPCATSAPLEGPVWARVHYRFIGDNGNYCRYIRSQRGTYDREIWIWKTTKNCGSVFQQVC